jgi:eukaryotic-like serine/threonine-protein kinase
MSPAVALRQDHLVLGRYRPLRPLGSGGSGSVWLVRDEQSSRDVALKVVPREGKTGSRAEREAEAASRLRHPRCLRALALDRDDEHVYVAYEYVAGRTLRAALRAGELDDAASVETAAQILEALGHAHGKRVVHRDVKPSNVMLEEGEGVSALLLDFGLAQLEEAETLTAADDIPGTLAYIAPERLQGKEATGAADVWSVGVILWESLAGWHPFWSASPVETAQRIGDGAPPLTQARPDLPRRLCTLIDRMLELEPRRRPPAKRLTHELRETFDERARRSRATTSPPVLRQRAVHAGLAALLAAGSGFVFPFFPAGWPLVLGALAALAAFWSPRAGLAVALAVPILPLGNAALGLALVYLALAAGWFALFARDPRSGLGFLAGPLLAPFGGLPLIALLATRARGQIRRAAVTAGACLAAFAAPALAGSSLPLTDTQSPLGLGIAGSENPTAVLRALLGFLADRPELIVALAALTVATLALPKARELGPWGVVLWATGLLTMTVLAPPLAGFAAVEAFPLVLGGWAAVGLLLARDAKSSRDTKRAG